MGLLGDIKHAFTGGGATVTATVTDARRAATATVVVEATAHTNMKISSVYVLVRATSTRETNHRGAVSDETTTVYEEKHYLAAEQELVEGQSYTWRGQVSIPEQLFSSPGHRLRFSGHDWEARAGLDVVGNDPDSGWQLFSVFDAAHP
ncbi:hypothetical protein BH11MYX2_BH11MYX2_31750 [soil metagenome]